MKTFIPEWNSVRCRSTFPLSGWQYDLTPSEASDIYIIYHTYIIYIYVCTCTYIAPHKHKTRKAADFWSKLDKILKYKIYFTEKSKIMKIQWSMGISLPVGPIWSFQFRRFQYNVNNDFRFIICTYQYIMVTISQGV